MRKAFFVAGLTFVALGLVAAACGGSEEKEGSNDNSGNGSQTLDMKAGDFFFDPKTATGEVGKPVTLKLENGGKAPRTFTIDELNVDKTLAPGEKATLTLMPEQGGPFSYYCRFHRARGMEGSITVSPGGATPAGGGATPSSGGAYPGY